MPPKKPPPVDSKLTRPQNNGSTKKSAPIKAAPIVSTPIKAAPIVSTPIITAPIISTPIKAAPIISTPILSIPKNDAAIMPKIILPSYSGPTTSTSYPNIQKTETSLTANTNNNQEENIFKKYPQLLLFIPLLIIIISKK